MNRYFAFLEILRQAWSQIVIFTYILTMYIGIAKLASLGVRTYSCHFKDLTYIYLPQKNQEQVFYFSRDIVKILYENLPYVTNMGVINWKMIKLICKYSYQVLKKSIFCHSSNDSLNFNVILIDISRIYKWFWCLLYRLSVKNGLVYFSVLV